MKLITCERCGKQELRPTNARFCLDCARARHLESTLQGIRRRKAGLPNVKQCKWCGKTFEAKTNQQYCSAECANQAYKAQQRAYYRSALKARRKEAKK